MGKGWTHPICEACWDERNPNREAIKILGDFRQEETCCFCGEKTKSGIYVRENPEKVEHCKCQEI